MDGRFAEFVASSAVAVAPDGTMAYCGCTYAVQAFPETVEGFYNEYDYESPLSLLPTASPGHRTGAASTSWAWTPPGEHRRSAQPVTRKPRGSVSTEVRPPLRSPPARPMRSGRASNRRSTSVPGNP
ncbi:hypothetical protein ACFQ51_18445 [Streptomyces kaempferi]